MKPTDGAGPSGGENDVKGLLTGASRARREFSGEKKFSRGGKSSPGRKAGRGKKVVKTKSESSGKCRLADDRHHFKAHRS